MKKPSLLFTFSLLLFTSLVAQAAPILLKSGTIDPQGQSGRPKARLMAAGASAAKGGLYIIQHEGAIPPGWRRQLRAAGARIRGYVPENAYIIEVKNGEAKLDVVVSRSDELGESADWKPVSTNEVTVSAPGEQGFFIVAPQGK